MRRFGLFCLALVALIGCSKPASAPAALASPPDLSGLAPHMKLLSSQMLPDTSGGKPLEVQMYLIDLGFNEAEKEIKPLLLGQGWQAFSPDAEKGVKQAGYFHLSKGSYVLVAADSGSPNNSTLAYTPTKATVVKSP